MTRQASAGARKHFRYAPADGPCTFERLFRVVVTHTYYTQDDGLCRDLRFAPEPASAKLMASLGMAFKEEEAGFSVLARPSDSKSLDNYLRVDAQGTPDQPQYWSRLTFLMTMTNPLFIGITALPIDTKPTTVNLYGSNLDAHRQGGAVVLSPGSFMDGDALYPVVGVEKQLVVPSSARCVTLADISGEVVRRCDVNASGKTTTPNVVTIDLSGLSYGFYTIGTEDAAGQPVDGSDYPRPVLYVPGRPLTMGVLDMLFTQPTPDSGGIYPTPSLFGDGSAAGQPGGTTYHLRFDARSTYWRYYVVPQRSSGTLDQLSIDGAGTSFRQHRQPVRLPDGALATLFEARKPLPLRQKSAQRFRLTGRRRDDGGQENDILVNRLPVAAPSPVWPAPAGSDTSGLSEIFVYV